MKVSSVGRTATTVLAAQAGASSSSLSMGRNTCISTNSAAAYQAHISKMASRIRPRVLAQTNGSGNYGESGTASFYMIDQLPLALANMTSTTSSSKQPPLERVDLDLGPNRMAFTIDNVLTEDEADALAACAEAVLEHNGHSRLAPGIRTPPGMRVNEAAHWYPSHDAATSFLGTILDRIRPLVPATIMDDHRSSSSSGNQIPLFPLLSEKVAQFKYNQGDQFNRHIDGLFPGQGANKEGTGIDEWTGVISGFSMLFFLNDYETDGLQGGETRLWSADATSSVDVAPRKGRVLVFRRGSPTAVLHAGLPVTGEVPKYMALINLAYGEQTGTQSML